MPTIDQITDHIFISGAIYESDFENLRNLHIQAIVNLMAYEGYHPPPDIAFFHYPQPDGLPYSSQALDHIYQ